ncbi:MAG: twin-arginine translocation signal domain-containing protein, partial [Alphaproteobacteria bacterium]
MDKKEIKSASKITGVDRRKFLKTGLAAGAGLGGMAVTGGVLRADQKPDPAIMNLPDWQHYLGDPVDA